jgi:phage terminase large subunit
MGEEKALDWTDYVRRWKASPFLFVLEALFTIEQKDWKPWVPGTERPPESPVGPELWQGNFLQDVGKAMVEGQRRFSVKAGHGVGKSTVEAWLILWFVLFHRNFKCPVTANSQDQLRDVVWAEIYRWWQVLPPFLKDQVEVKAERVVVKASPEGSFAVARTARPEKPEALQGFHAETLAFFIEEASGIEDIIFETAGGALSSEDSWVFMFANPTRSSGYFHRSHTSSRTSWRTYTVSCFQSSRVSPEYAKEIAEEYGEDSNVYRVRVLGEFPLSEDDAVISLGMVEPAIGREVSPSESGIVWGLDVARFGDDTTALCKRRGNVVLEPIKEWKKLDLMQVTGIIVREFNETRIENRPGAINVDVIGLGAGVVDRLRELQLPVRGINVGESPSSDTGRYMRLRDELWFKARDWFDSRAVLIPDDPGLISELVQPKYKIESTGKIKVESKDDMKKRGIKSPNKADAFCLTFAGGDFIVHQNMRVAEMAYDPFNVNVGSMDYERALRQTQAGTDYTPF